MRRTGAWALGGVALVGLCVGTPLRGAGDEDADAKPAVKSSWFGRPQAGAKAAEKKPAAQAEAPKKPVRSAQEAAVAERQREEQALLRRLEVCDRLRQVASATSDQELYRLADELTERAQAVYGQRTAHLPASAAAYQSDEQALDRHLGDGAAASPAGLPGRSDRGGKGQAALGVEKP